MRQNCIAIARVEHLFGFIAQIEKMKLMFYYQSVVKKTKIFFNLSTIKYNLNHQF